MKVAKVLRFAPVEKPLQTLTPGKQIPGISPKGLELRANKILNDLGTFIKKQAKVTKGRTKIKGRKTLKNQDKVTYSDALDKVIIKPKPGELERTLRLIEKINKNLNKTNTGRKIQKRQLNLFKNFKKIENPTDLSDLGGSQSNDIALAPTNNIFIIQQGDNSTQSTPQTQSGDTILIGGGTFDSFDAEINIRQMEILQTA